MDDGERLAALLDAGPRFATAQLTVLLAGEGRMRAWLAGPRRRLEQQGCVDVWDGTYHWHESRAYACRVPDRDGSADGVRSTGRSAIDLMLRPAALRPTHRVTSLGLGDVAGRPVLRARVVPRREAFSVGYVGQTRVVAAWHALGPFVLADDAEIAVDAEHGVLLAIRARHDGQDYEPLIVTEAVFDQPLPDERFTYVPTPGRDVTFFD